jgi:hypothetical protein
MAQNKDFSMVLSPGDCEIDDKVFLHRGFSPVKRKREKTGFSR